MVRNEAQDASEAMSTPVDPLYVSALESAARRLGLSLAPGLAEALGHHQALVNKWAGRINLTTVTDPEQAAIRHGLDCLLFAERFEPEATDEVVDVGSGAGYPGLVLALARPRLRMRLLEPIRKRASFLRVALTELGRPDVQVTEGRMEVADPAPWQAEVIVSRATIPPLELVARAAPYLRPGGRLLVTGGAGAPEVDALVEAAVGLAHVGRWTHRLPGGIERVIDALRLLG